MSTEYMIVRAVERESDILDRDYLNGALSEGEYRTAQFKVDAWASSQYERMRAARHGQE